MNYKHFLHACNYDLDFADTIIDTIENDFPIHIESMNTAFNNDNLSLLKSCLSHIKISLIYLGFDNLYTDVNSLEDYILEHNRFPAIEKLLLLIDTLVNLPLELRRECNNLKIVH